jgi:hypothetical protein
MEPFTRIDTSSGLIAAFDDDEHVLVIYNLIRSPCPTPGRRWSRLPNGKIREMTIIFARLGSTWLAVRHG